MTRMTYEIPRFVDPQALRSPDVVIRSHTSPRHNILSRIDAGFYSAVAVGCCARLAAFEEA